MSYFRSITFASQIEIPFGNSLSNFLLKTFFIESMPKYTYILKYIEKSEKKIKKIKNKKLYIKTKNSYQIDSSYMLLSNKPTTYNHN